MKKFIAVFMAVLMLCSLLTFYGSALSLNEGTEALDAQFLDGEYNDCYDFVYYSPKTGESDTTKYPIFIWLHGMRAGNEKRDQLKYYEFSNWSSDEYQSRFDVGGCYLLCPRASDPGSNGWNGNSCLKLKRTIDKFIIANNRNIDTDRIYIGGYSVGGECVWNMISQFTGFFAAAIPIASVFQPTTDEITKVSNLPIWIFCADKDYYPFAETEDVKHVFSQLKSIAADKSKIRMTSISDARYATGQKKGDGNGNVADDAEHFIFETVTYDMHMADRKTPYIYSTTIDGNGVKSVVNGSGQIVNDQDGFGFSDKDTGVIKWLSAQSRKDSSQNESVKLSFFQRVKMFFQRLWDIITGMFK